MPRIFLMLAKLEKVGQAQVNMFQVQPASLLLRSLIAFLDHHPCQRFENMQEQYIFESSHFWTGSVVLALLAANGFISLTKFSGNRSAFRTTHAYLGSIALCIMFIHAVLGLRLGLTI